MAKRKSKKRHHSRRRRYSSIHGVKSVATSALAIVGGAVAAEFLVNALDSVSAIKSQSYGKYIEAGAPIIIGAFLPRFIKSDIGKNIGAGMMAVGGLKLAQGLGVVSGLPAISLAPSRMNPRGTIALAPSRMNPRGTVAGLNTYKAAILTA